eukprot:COSAG04_NODE_2627_length_3835_cov_7.778105_4_plen_161_part_00
MAPGSCVASITSAIILRLQDKATVTLFGEQAGWLEEHGLRPGDIVQLSHIHFKSWGDPPSFSGNTGSQSRLLVACRAGDAPPRIGRLPISRVYERRQLLELHAWAASSVWKAYLKPSPGRSANHNNSGATGEASWDECSTAAELSRHSEGRVCFGGVFTE